MSAPRRLHHHPLPPDGGALELGPEVARHARVLRLTEGDHLVLFDGEGHEADAVIVELDARVVCRVDPPRAVDSSRPRVVLVQCVPKGSKLDGIVRGATELGVAAVHLALSERCVSRPKGERAHKRVERLEKIAREAARQCGRADVPEVHAPVPLLEAAARAPEDASRLAFVVGAESELGGAGEAWVLVGPEGGLAPDEAAALASDGWMLAGLGTTTLRVETAAIVAVALSLHARLEM